MDSNRNRAPHRRSRASGSPHPRQVKACHDELQTARLPQRRPSQERSRGPHQDQPDVVICAKPGVVLRRGTEQRRDEISCRCAWTDRDSVLGLNGHPHGLRPMLEPSPSAVPRLLKGQSPVKSVQKGPVLRPAGERASDRDSVFLRFLFLLSVFCKGRNTKEGEADRSIGLIA